MRLLNALKADITFQYRQGFYWVYMILTIIYMAIMSKLPHGDIKAYSIVFIILSDPSVVGFFFIGGIVMLEKVQGVIKYLGVTPVTSLEYLGAKALSLSLVSLAAGLVITKVTYTGRFNAWLLIAGILLISCFFTLYGFLVAAGCRTINQYFIKMVPFMLLIIVPCFSFFIKTDTLIFDIFPSVASLRLIYGAFFGMPPLRMMLDICLLLLAVGIILAVAHKSYTNMLISEEE